MTEPKPVAKYALVIGNADYGSVSNSLKNPVTDARAIANKLHDLLKFKVVCVENANSDEMRLAFAAFCDRLRTAASGAEKSVGVLYYAGHGVQVRGENYLLPVKETIRTESNLIDKSLRLSDLLTQMRQAGETCIAFLDCCRDNPFPKSSGADGAARALPTGNGLAAPIVRSDGLFISFATAPDSFAFDGVGANSIYTGALLGNIGKQNNTIFSMMIDVRLSVGASTKWRQLPWDQYSLVDNFGFNYEDGFDPRNLPSPQELKRKREEEYWTLTRGTDSPDLIRSFIGQFPQSQYKLAAQQLLDRLIVTRWREKALRRVAQVMLGAFALFAAWFSGMWLSFSDMDGKLRQADLYGGDIDLPVTMVHRFKDRSIKHCRAACILSRASGCVGFTYNPKTLQGRGRCFLKKEAPYFVENNDSVSMYLASQFFSPGSEAPMSTKFSIVSDRKPYGKQVEPALAQDGKSFRLEDTIQGKINYRTPSQEKPRWSVSRTDCEQRCVDLPDKLGSACVGFTYSAINSECQLFSEIDGMLTYPDASNAKVTIRGIFSGVARRER